MKELGKYFNNAKSGGFAIWKLNFLLGIAIPFNSAHKIKVVKVSDTEVTTSIPFIKKNFNHIRGTHACGLAAAGEFASGLLLLGNLDSAKFRLIMQKIEVEYHFQAKKEVLATCTIEENDLEENVYKPLMVNEKTNFICTSHLKDIDDNLVATVTTDWQIKSWEKVKTKIT